MITTLTIKKKYLYFFIISLFLSTFLTYVLDRSLNENNSIRPCDQSLSVDYKYKRNWLKSDKSRIHQFIVNRIDTELEKFLDENTYYFDGEVINFKSNCKETIKKIDNLSEELQISISKSLFLLQGYITENKITISQTDSLIFYYLINDKVFEFSKSKPMLEDNTKSVNFLIILIIMNLIYLAFVNIKIKLG